MQTLKSILALYGEYATLAALLPRCGKGTLGMRLIFALSHTFRLKFGVVLNIPEENLCL
jgi:hypothetical protein